MMLIVPWLPDTQPTTIEIDGITYSPPLVDSAGRLVVTAQFVGANDERILVDADGRVYANAYTAGASEVIAARYRSVDPSTTRVTIATPTSGKKIRLISAGLSMWNLSIVAVELYFGTGTNITTNPGKEITETVLDGDVNLAIFLSWPDGAGPVGAVNDVLSFRTGSNVLANSLTVVHYREE